MGKDKKRKIEQSANLFGGYSYYEDGKKIGESRPNLFGGYTNYDANGKKIGSSERKLFGGGYTHYDNNGNIIGSSEDYWLGGGSRLYDRDFHRSGDISKDIFTIAAEDSADSYDSLSVDDCPASHKGNYFWREFACAGDEYGIDPEEYETEEEYEEAVEEARDKWRSKYDDICWDYDAKPYDYESEEEYLEAIREEGYEEDLEWMPEEIQSESRPKKLDESALTKDDDNKPTDEDFALFLTQEGILGVSPSLDPQKHTCKRRFYAAKDLFDIRRNDYLFYVDDDQDLIISRCEFILTNPDVLASHYMTHNGIFLYGQAIRDNFPDLPCHIELEDEEQKNCLPQIIKTLAETDPMLAASIWKWCIDHFLPYRPLEMFMCNDLLQHVVDAVYFLPEMKELVLKCMTENELFRDSLTCENGLCWNTAYIIIDFLNSGDIETAKELLSKCLECDDEALYFDCLISNLIDGCINHYDSYYDNESNFYDNNLALTMLMRETLFPLVRVAKSKSRYIKKQLSKWEQEIQEYIDSCVEEQKASDDLLVW